MDYFVIGVILIIAVAFILFVIAKKSEKSGKNGGEKPKKKKLLTEREQSMYNRLVQSLPEHIVLAQVSQAALLTAKLRGTRNRFDRKIADFVICDKAFQVIAVVELDDASHKEKGGKDAARDAMLVDAGYRTVRYKNIPEIAKIQADLS